MAPRMIRSGLASTFRLHFTDGATEDVTTIPGDAMAWERLEKRPFQENVSASALLWTAWRALRREKRCDETRFETWADSLADFEVDTGDDGDEDADDDEDRPTSAVRSVG